MSCIHRAELVHTPRLHIEQSFSLFRNVVALCAQRFQGRMRCCSKLEISAPLNCSLCRTQRLKVANTAVEQSQGELQAAGLQGRL